MRTQPQVIGASGEDLARIHLMQQGYSIVAKNYRTRFGELDIIAWSTKLFGGKTLCFIEVKTRSGERGSAERATTPEKIRKMKMAAHHFCLTHNIPIDATPIQFEHVSVYMGKPPHIIRYDIPIS